MRECFCTAAEAHVLAEIIPAFGTVAAVVAHDAGLDGNSLTGNEMFHAGADGGNDACCFMTED